MTATASDGSAPAEGHRTGTVYGINSSMIVIGAEKFFLGECKAVGIGKGDTVEFAATADFLTHLILIAKADGTSAAAPPAKATKKTTPAEQQPPACVLGECPDKTVHMKFHSQRNRWECNLQGIDNPQISHCPLVPKTPAPKQTSSPELDEKARTFGFGTPTEGPSAKPEPVKVPGVYIGNNDTAIMIRVGGVNKPYLATPELIKYLRSKDCKAVVNANVLLTIEDRGDGRGPRATAIGPAPEASPAEGADQKPPATTPPVGEQKPPATSPPPAAGPAPEHTLADGGMAHIVPYQQPRTIITGPMQFDEDQINLIKSTVARNCTDTEFKLLMYLASQYHLDPIRKQIWAVKYNDAPASIFTGRDGFLAIAHRDGNFNGMESGVKTEGTEMIGWCRIWRKDMSHPFYIEVYLSDYQQPAPRSGKPTLWQKMPRVMIQKVAESTCLRRAFSICGLYSPEEIDTSGGA